MNRPGVIHPGAIQSSSARLLRRSHPQAYFGGLVALAKMIRWETTEEMLSDGGMTPDEIMDKLEQRVGPFSEPMRKPAKPFWATVAGWRLLLLT